MRGEGHWDGGGEGVSLPRLYHEDEGGGQVGVSRGVGECAVGDLSLGGGDARDAGEVFPHAFDE